MPMRSEVKFFLRGQIEDQCRASADLVVQGSLQKKGDLHSGGR
jgi:hypothetical protein